MVLTGFHVVANYFTIFVTVAVLIFITDKVGHFCELVSACCLCYGIFGIIIIIIVSVCCIYGICYGIFIRIIILVIKFYDSLPCVCLSSTLRYFDSDNYYSHKILRQPAFGRTREL